MTYSKLYFLIAAIISLVPTFLRAQEIDILIKDGHVLDPKNKIDSKLDIAISKGMILKVAKGIPITNVKKVIDASGMYVIPGLIDLHTHVFVGSNEGFADGFSSISPDDITFKSGITTVVDAGTSGWRNFNLFKRNVIERSQTRVLSFLNIAGSGMTGFPFEEDINDMDARMTSLMIHQNPEIIVGVKLGHFSGSDWTPFDRAIEAATLANVPLFLECHLPLYPLEDILQRMRSGDIYSHSYCTATDRTSLLDDSGIVRPYVWEAQKKGILFDVGHGGVMFHFSSAVPAVNQGFFPNSFGTDLHRFSMNSGMKNMLDLMSKFLNMGMSFKDIVFRATWNSARSIKRDDLGDISVGSIADVAILSIQEGKFGFVDTKGVRLDGDKRLQAEVTIRAGKIVWDQNGISAEKFSGKLDQLQ